MPRDRSRSYPSHRPRDPWERYDSSETYAERVNRLLGRPPARRPVIPPPPSPYPSTEGVSASVPSEPEPVIPRRDITFYGSSTGWGRVVSDPGDTTDTWLMSPAQYEAYTSLGLGGAVEPAPPEPWRDNGFRVGQTCTLKALLEAGCRVALIELSADVRSRMLADNRIMPSWRQAIIAYHPEWGRALFRFPPYINLDTRNLENNLRSDIGSVFRVRNSQNVLQLVDEYTEGKWR